MGNVCCESTPPAIDNIQTRFLTQQSAAFLGTGEHGGATFHVNVFTMFTDEEAKVKLIEAHLAQECPTGVPTDSRDKPYVLAEIEKKYEMLQVVKNGDGTLTALLCRKGECIELPYAKVLGMYLPKIRQSNFNDLRFCNEVTFKYSFEKQDDSESDMPRDVATIAAGSSEFKRSETPFELDVVQVGDQNALEITFLEQNEKLLVFHNANWTNTQIPKNLSCAAARDWKEVIDAVKRSKQKPTDESIETEPELGVKLTDIRRRLALLTC